MPRFKVSKYRGDPAVLRHVAGVRWVVTGTIVARYDQWEAYPAHRVGGPVSQLHPSFDEAVEWLLKDLGLL